MLASLMFRTFFAIATIDITRPREGARPRLVR
jgi:hypothetical protein